MAAGAGSAGAGVCRGAASLHCSPLLSHPTGKTHRVSGCSSSKALVDIDLMAKLRRNKKLAFCRLTGTSKSKLSSPYECWKFYFLFPTTTPYSQAGFLLPPITGMRDVHIHRSTSRSVTQEIRNVSPGMTAGRRLGVQPPSPDHVFSEVRTTLEKITSHHLIRDSSEGCRCQEVIKPAASLCQP